MPSYSKDNEQYHIDRIREMLFIRPKAGALMVQRMLEQDGKSPLHLHQDYINRLLQKIRKERAHRQYKKINEEVATMEDEFEWLREETIRILLGNTDAAGKIRAINAMWKMRIELYEAKLNAGIFERRLGVLEIEKRYRPLPPDLKVKIIEVMKNWNIIPEIHEAETSLLSEYANNERPQSAIGEQESTEHGVVEGQQLS